MHLRLETASRGLSACRLSFGEMESVESGHLRVPLPLTLEHNAIAE
jgi:hypothetical protein